MHRRIGQIAINRTVAQFKGFQWKRTVQILNRTRLNLNTTPLYFNNPVIQISLTDAEKEQRRLFFRERRRHRYSKLSKLADSSTTLIVHLISKFMLKQPNLTSKELSNAVKSIYWGLRVYMQTDFGGERDDRRDDMRDKFKTVRHEI